MSAENAQDAAHSQDPVENAPAEGAEPKKKGRFEPKYEVHLEPPKDDPISLEYLNKCDGTNPEYPTLVAIKGKVYDVSTSKAYAPGGGYHLFAGHDASRALAKVSLKAEDVRPEWYDLPDSEKGTLEDWVTYFGKRYNVVGLVEGAENT